MNELQAINVIIQKERFDCSSLFFKDISPLTYAVIKGEPLSILAFGQKGKRVCTDIDLLVPRNKVGDVELLLRKNGFQTKEHSRSDEVIMRAFSHQISPWEKQCTSNNKVVIDLNYDIFWGEYTGERIDISSFLSDTVEVDLYGCTVKTLPPLKSMIQLILHHYKEMNSIFHLTQHNSIKRHMFADVYYLWKNNKLSISVDKLLNASVEYHIVPYVYYILYYTGMLFYDPVFCKMIKQFQTDEGIQLLDYYGLSEKERKKWPVDFQTRLDADDLFKLIQDDLTKEDVEKLERNKRIFG